MPSTKTTTTKATQTKPVLTGAQVRAIRIKMGLTLQELGKKLGYGGPNTTQIMSEIEREATNAKSGQRRYLNYAHANLLLAIAEGYEPVHEVEDGHPSIR